MGIMDKTINWWMRKQSPQQKRDMMDKMMPKMMEGCMESMGSGNMMETMHEMMPRMMENCLDKMSEEERLKMFGFCHKMLEEMEGRFLAPQLRSGKNNNA